MSHPTPAWGFAAMSEFTRRWMKSNPCHEHIDEVCVRVSIEDCILDFHPDTQAAYRMLGLARKPFTLIRRGGSRDPLPTWPPRVSVEALRAAYGKRVEGATDGQG